MDESNNQQKDNKTSSSMLSRSAQILQAAAPYLDENSTQMLESVVRINDFFDTMQSIRQRGFPLFFQKKRPRVDTVSMANLAQPQPPIDMESLLRSIRPFCSPREGSMIDQIMSFFNIQRVFSMYQTIMNMMSTMNAANGNESSEGNSNFSNPFMNMNGDMSQMMNMAAMMSQMMNNNAGTNPNAGQNTNSTTDSNAEGDPTYNDQSYYNNTSNYQDCSNNASNYQNYSNNTSDYQDFNNNTTAQDTYWNSQNMNYRHGYESASDSNPDFNNSNTQTYTKPSESDTTPLESDTTPLESDTTPLESDTAAKTSSTGQSSNSKNSNKQMLEMLSTMIPPEQKSTFEAMKLLVESGIIK